MTATTFDSGALPNLPYKVKATTLLIMMLTVPAGILVALADNYLFHDGMRLYAENHPIKVAWWIALLSTPHIVASFFTFADRDYIRHYAPQLTKGIIISVILGICLPLGFGYLLRPDNMQDIDFSYLATFDGHATLVAAAFYTTYHNLQQQYGISLMLMQEKPTLLHHLWKWITIIPASLLFVGMLLFHEINQWNDAWPRFVLVAAINWIPGGIVAFLIITRYLKKPGYSKIGLAYFCANALMLLVSFGLVLKGYVLIAMLMPRVIHDLTAYWIYMVHDENRNADTLRNPVYALPAKIGIGPAWLCVPLSFVLAYLMLEIAEGFHLFNFLIIVLNFLHYYIEGYIWKRGTPHRSYVPFILKE